MTLLKLTTILLLFHFSCIGMEETEKNIKDTHTVSQKFITLDKVENIEESDLFTNYKIETENRVTIFRDDKGCVKIVIQPKEKPVTIGEKVFTSPRSISGGIIDIGSIHFDYEQTDEEFLNMVNKIGTILYKSSGKIINKNI